MPIYDDKGRITQLTDGDGVCSGHSVCVSCGTDMPGCWQVVCKGCNKTFCYACSLTGDGFWFCVSCNAGRLESIPISKAHIEDKRWDVITRAFEIALSKAGISPNDNFEINLIARKIPSS